MAMCLDANSGSPAVVQVSPFGRYLGLPTSSDTISPFPNVRPAGYASMADIKRQRLDTSNNSITSPLTSSPQSPSTSTDLLSSQDLAYAYGIPPAYDNLSLTNTPT